MTCGEDGCGGVCGQCADDEFCTDAGKCEATTGPTYTRTRYPIVLAHGMMGFQKLFGVVEYFYKIPEALKSDGATVYTTDVSGADDSVTRGEQLLLQIEQIIATSGASRVNIVSHSQGGLDARYVAAIRPDLVASITAVAGPHQGSEFATYCLAHLSPDGTFFNVAADLTGVLAEVIKLVSGASKPEDGQASLYALSSAGALAFNRQFPAGLPTKPCGEGPAYIGHMGLWSWGGDAPVTNIVDVSDPWFAVTSRFFSEKNDGLVGHCSTHFGTVLRDDYRMNHLDEMNQFVGLTSPFEVSTIEVYRIQANRLRLAGF
jgi:triacylglycerol lipase